MYTKTPKNILEKNSYFKKIPVEKTLPLFIAKKRIGPLRKM
jgi:hypothetical protein